MMKHFRWLSFLLLAGMQGAFCPAAGSAESSRAGAGAGQDKDIRVAVVIGNSRYPSGALQNPKNDATAMAASLRKLGFDVELKLDATKADMDAVFKTFSRKAEKATVAAVFYAGHGIQVNGSNYIVPIDAQPKSERDLKREMIKMDDVIDDMGAARVKLIFFDACRDNPLSRSFGRGGSRGMAAPVEATGTLISFATKHGNTAADGDGRHSPYTTALLAALENPAGVEIEQMLRKVQQGVKQATSGQQEPWRYGSLDGDFYFKAADAVAESGRRQDAAVLEAMRQENERAAIERSELQLALKSQQEASDRAVAEAIKRSNEQAARERAELQQSMERMLKEALARQSQALEAERRRRQPSDEAVKAQALAPPPAAPISSPQPKAVQLAKLTPASSGGTSSPSEKSLADLANAPGDEWEYLATDEKFGKKQKLVLRVKAVSADGVLEEVIWKGKPFLEWVFRSRPAAVGSPNESEFMFAPHWDGSELSDFQVEGGSGFCTGAGVSCRINVKISGSEKLTIAAGTFDAVRLDGWMTLRRDQWATQSRVTIWYSTDQRRLLKQSAELNAIGVLFPKFKETLELTTIRRAPR